MSENVIMNDEMMDEVTENAVEVVTTSKSAKLVKAGVGLALVTLGGVVLYKKVIKPIAAKVKAKKAAKAVATENVELEDEPVKLIYDENGNAIED